MRGALRIIRDLQMQMLQNILFNNLPTNLGCDINLTARGNQLNFRSLLDYVWYLYSNMSVDAVENDFEYDLGPWLCGRDKFDEIRIYVAWNTC